MCSKLDYRYFIVPHFAFEPILTGVRASNTRIIILGVEWVLISCTAPRRREYVEYVSSYQVLNFLGITKPRTPNFLVSRFPNYYKVNGTQLPPSCNYNVYHPFLVTSLQFKLLRGAREVIFITRLRRCTGAPYPEISHALNITYITWHCSPRGQMC